MTAPTSIDFIYLSEPDMVEAGVNDIARCVDVMEETFVLMHKGDYMMAGVSGNSNGAMINFPEKPKFATMPSEEQGRRFMAMPAYLGGRFGNTGVKWYGSNAENKDKGLPRAIHLLTLSDTVTGAPLAIMSANLLSACRAGAVPGVGVKHLAAPDATTLAVIGTGVMARTNTDAAISQRPSITTIRVVGQSGRGMDAYTEHIEDKHPEITVVPVESIEEACHGADIVLAAAVAEMGDVENFPYIDQAWLAPGTLCLLPAAARFDDEFLKNDARLVLDARGLYEAWGEELGDKAYATQGIPGNHWLELENKGELPAEKLEVIAEISDGESPGHDPNKVVLYSVGGMPVEDVAWATEVYGNAIKRGLGTSLNLWESPAMV